MEAPGLFQLTWFCGRQASNFSSLHESWINNSIRTLISSWFCQQRLQPQPRERLATCQKSQRSVFFRLFLLKTWPLDQQFWPYLGTYLEMQNSRPHPRLTEAESAFWKDYLVMHTHFWSFRRTVLNCTDNRIHSNVKTFTSYSQLGLSQCAPRRVFPWRRETHRLFSETLKFVSQHLRLTCWSWRTKASPRQLL